MPDFNKLCRACLSVMDTFKYYLFDNVSPQDYWFCTSIEVMRDGNLPKSICNICYQHLSKLLEFKNACIKSETILLNYCSVKPEDAEKELQKQSDESKELKLQNNNIAISDQTCNDSFDIKEEIFVENGFDTAEFTEEFDISKHKIKKRVKPKQLKRRKKFKCELCTKSFFCQDRFEVHKLAHQTKVTSLKCMPCSKSFITWSGLRRHRASCHVRVRLSSVRCRTCGKIAKSRETLRTHEKLHGERRLLMCNVCGKGCTTTSVLKAHLETHRENREREYTCEHCGKKFYTNKILASHVQRCHTGRKYICQICSFPFTDKYNLAKHLRNHDNKSRIGNFKCEICEKSYVSKTSYVEHQRTHTGERPYICSFCSKSFISKRRLIEHIRTHTGEKPHKCAICDYSFAQRGTLTRHLKVHDRAVPLNF